VTPLRVELAARLVQVAVQRPALVVVQAVAPVIALGAALGLRVAAALPPVRALAPFRGLGVDIRAGAPPGRDGRASEPCRKSGDQK
jgi:hypothetical protein